MASVIHVPPGMRFEPISVSITEASTPTAGDDSSGQIGTFSFTTNARMSSEAYEEHRTRETEFGPSILLGSECTIFTSERGFVSGVIDDVQVNHDAGTINASGLVRTGALSVFNIQAKPWVGTLDGAFRYYLGLAGITTGIEVDGDLAALQVNFPGWYGELWFHIKQMVASVGAELALVADTFLLRRLGTQQVGPFEKSSLSVTYGTQTLAQSVEVYYFNNRQISNELVYPPRGWNSEVEVLTVNAEETEEYTLELEASISDFQSPVMREFVSSDYTSSSVYTIVADDGRPVKPAQWTAFGGSLNIRIGEDTKTLVVTLTGARGIPLATGGTAKTFSVALGSDLTGNRYSTLRIVGTGVAFDKQVLTIPTGVPASRTATEVGITIENPFLSTLDQAYTVGVPAARRYSGYVPAMTASGTHLTLDLASDFSLGTDYETVREAVSNEIGPGVAMTYANVKSFTEGEAGTPLTYRSDLDYWQGRAVSEDLFQPFGNIQGARLFEPEARRWFRIREVTLEPGTFSIARADDDNRYDDAAFHWEGQTYQDMSIGIPNDFSYLNADMAGLFDDYI